MTIGLNIADILFLQTQVNLGWVPAPGTDPFSLLGLRAVDGSHNNLTHVVITDQHGNVVNTDAFANVDQEFFNIVDQDPNNPSPALPNDYAQTPESTTVIVDSSPRIISNLVADMSASNDAFIASEADAVGNPGAPAFSVAPTNTLFTFFGQFFDHGLDFIDKGGSGTIMISLPPNDPLLSDPNLQFGAMFLDRATLTPVIDPNTGLQATDPNTGELLWKNNNSTAPLVEQSQTYGQKETTKFYLKEYDTNGNATGRLVTHEDSGMATWQDIKDNVFNAFGIVLEDKHVLNIPDASLWGNPQYWDPTLNNNLGGFIDGPDGKPLAGTGQSFLADIAHEANPFDSQTGLFKVADNDVGNADPSGIGLFDDTGNPAYDNELLAAHKVAGDPRANENIALTAVHSAFHSEHNRIVELVKDLVLQQSQIDPGILAQWQIAPNVWDGDKLFEAAKVVNENQYQHMVFEEFARRLSPNIDAFAQYDVTINPNISAEFSQAVYRLGHSMLTDTVSSVNAAGQANDMTLVDAFLNPVAFDAIGAGAVVKGSTQQEMNQIDEFVTDALRNMLVGLPLDLAALNIARGRDVGLPTLNETRQELYLQTNEGTLAPYTSWSDFGAHLLHPASLLNFIAAYSRDQAIINARNAGDNALARDLAATKMNDATFMNGGDLGFWDIDLWIGGLAEQKAGGPIGAPPSMLGTTFDFIFATQLRALQDGDRLYYLARLGGTNILTEIESMKFGDLYERGTGARHTNGDIFGIADQYVELSTDNSTTFASVAGVWMEVIGGTTQADTIRAGAGNDTVWGEDGDDQIWGDEGNDVLYGNAGNDTIHGGDGLDFIRGDAGDDTLYGDGGDDLIFGKDGNDALYGGAGFDTLEGGLGNDILDGGDQDDTLVGQENDDVLRGGSGNDALDGGAGNDWLQGDRGNDTLLGFEGDDVLDGGAGADVLDGGGLLANPGHDVASYQSSPNGLTIDLAVPANSTGDAVGDTYINIEEILGSKFADIITGDALDNILNGGGALSGTGDQLHGGLGVDVLYGNEGRNDLLDGGDGIDPITGLAFRDQVVYLGHASTDFIISVDALGNGTVQENFLINPNDDPATGARQLGAIDTLTSIEEIVFDDGIFSTQNQNSTTQKWIPLVNVTNSMALTLDDGILNGNVAVIDGNIVNDPNAYQIFDNTGVVTSLTNLNSRQFKVGNIEIIDPDGVSGTQTVTLGGADQAAFRIVTNTQGGLELYFIGGPLGTGFRTVNFEAQDRYEVTVNVADGSGASAITYTLNVTDRNDNAPLFTSPDHIYIGANAWENGSPLANVVVYRPTAIDRDTVTNIDAAGAVIVGPAVPGNALKYSLKAFNSDPVTGNNNDMFTMSSTGEVRVASGVVPAVGTYILEVIASDGVAANDTTKRVFVTVSEPNAAPVFDTSPAGNIFIAENTAASTVVWDAAATDPGGLPVTFSLSGPDAALFSIDSLTGEIRFIQSPDFETPLDGNGVADNIYAITVQASDGSAVATQDVNVEVTNVAGVTITGGSGVDLVTPTASTLTNQPLPTAEEDTIRGFGATDVLDGGDGNDTLLGGAGDDVLLGGNGNDTLQGNEGNDVLFGGAGADVISGGDGMDQVFGGAGADIMDGGLGNDHIYVDDAGDTVIEAAGAGVFDVVFTQVDMALDNTQEVESLRANAGATGLTLTGNDLDNHLMGNSGSDTLSGGLGIDVLEGLAGADVLSGDDGDDRLYGGADSDTLSGGMGNDLLNGGTGADTLDGGDGNDTYFVDDLGDLIIEAIGSGTNDIVFTTVNLTLDNTQEIESLRANAGATGLTLTGNDLNNHLMGNAGSDTLSGGLGIDVLEGGSGADVLSGDDGNDRLYGDGEGDTLFGGIGNDLLNGGAGTDVLDGGDGNDTLTGGADADTFVFGANWGVDYVTDFEDGIDQFDLSPSGATAYGDLVVDQNFGGSGHALVTFGSNMILVYNAANLIDSTDFIF